MYTLLTKNLHTRVIFSVLVATFILFMYGFAERASAHQDPGSCTSSGVGVSIAVYESDGVTPADVVSVGDTIKYQATLSWLGGSNCYYDGGDLDINTPDGINHDVDGGSIPLVTGSTPFVSSMVSYVVDASDISGGLVTASTVYTGGTSHRAIHQTVGGTSNISNSVTGNIIVDKVTNPSGNTTSFSFDAVGDGYDDFSLTDAGAPNDQTLVPGSYSVSETVPSGWTQTSVSCVSSLDDTETANALELDAGETITCTFTNTEDMGHIIVDKVTDPSGDTTIFNFNATGSGYDNFSLTDAGAPNDQELAAGSYSVSETLPTGWAQDSVVCVSSIGDTENANALELDAGETITCTFNNSMIHVVEWCSPGYWRNHQDEAEVAADAGGFSLTDLYSSQFGSAPKISKKAQKDGATGTPTLWQVLQSPQWYGGDAYNKVADLLSGSHPDLEFEMGDPRIENCPLN